MSTSLAKQVVHEPRQADAPDIKPWATDVPIRADVARDVAGTAAKAIAHELVGDLKMALTFRYDEKLGMFTPGNPTPTRASWGEHMMKDGTVHWKGAGCTDEALTYSATHKMMQIWRNTTSRAIRESGWPFFVGALQNELKKLDAGIEIIGVAEFMTSGNPPSLVFHAPEITANPTDAMRRAAAEGGGSRR